MCSSKALLITSAVFPVLAPVTLPMAASAGEAESEMDMAKAAERAAQKRAVDSQERGAEAVGQIRMEGAQAAGAQRAATAANGVDLSSAGAQNLFDSTSAGVELDANTAKVNALREAWGHRLEASQARFDYKRARRKSVLGPLQSGLSSSMQIASLGMAGGGFAGKGAGAGSGSGSWV